MRTEPRKLSIKVGSTHYEMRGYEMKASDMIESKFLKKEDVDLDGFIVTMSKIEQVNVALPDEKPDMKYALYFDEFDKPLVLNSTNIQSIAQATGSDETDNWRGKKIIIYHEPNVSFGGKLVGGIRVKAHRISAGPKAAPVKASAAKPEPGSASKTDQLADDIPF